MQVLIIQDFAFETQVGLTLTQVTNNHEANAHQNVQPVKIRELMTVV